MLSLSYIILKDADESWLKSSSFDPTLVLPQNVEQSKSGKDGGGVYKTGEQLNGNHVKMVGNGQNYIQIVWYMKSCANLLNGLSDGMVIL